VKLSERRREDVVEGRADFEWSVKTRNDVAKNCSKD
jgi:hypothetical protein